MAAAGAFVAAWSRQAVEGEKAATVVLSTGNAAGRKAAELLLEREPAVEAVTLLPWDRPRAVGRWLEALAPDAVVVVETELWPGLFFACHRRRIPLLVASGRIYPRDVARYRAVRRFFRSVLECPAAIGVQSEAERERFLAIGAPASRLVVGGDLKLDALPAEPSAPPRIPAGRPLLVAGSTHPGEERLLLDVFSHLRGAFPGLALVLAPRHPDRAGEVARLATSAGLRTAFHSAGHAAAAGAEIVVVDEIGPLASLYRAADVAIVGGSFVPRGGHNPLEAAAHGRPVVIGPCVEHVGGAVALLEAARAIERLETADGAALEAALRSLLSNDERRLEMGAAARSAIAAARGSSDRYVGMVRELLGTPP
jgi:3-deoxy-D-manno-octulosonic-acid transferase